MAQELNVIRKVLVRSVVTEKLKTVLGQEIEGNLHNLQEDYKRFQAHREGYLAQCKEKDVKPDYELMKKMAIEEEKFNGSRVQLSQKLQEIQSLVLDSEYAHGTVDSPVSIKVGDNWHTQMTGFSVLLEDGIVKDVQEQEINV
ncbi:MAG: hypothetical protein COB02_08175 [Candidatus Cloacimonadota bacterium]|nr:MAG: hypothetical protein COB02_08175 [Candidatus Cloacimonadota bacterium]